MTSETIRVKCFRTNKCIVEDYLLTRPVVIPKSTRNAHVSLYFVGNIPIKLNCKQVIVNLIVGNHLSVLWHSLNKLRERFQRFVNIIYSYISSF
ncbi:hypothetical protein D3C85_1266980 [compost metagenome]